jgi:hypothetical protein
MNGSLNPSKCRELAIEFRAQAACMANSPEKEALLAAADEREKIAAVLEIKSQPGGSDVPAAADD